MAQELSAQLLAAEASDARRAHKKGYGTSSCSLRGMKNLKHSILVGNGLP